MKVVSVRPAPAAEVFDISVHGTHTFTTESGVVLHNCYGKTCGVCDARDLSIRRGYIDAANEEVSVDLNDLKIIDQRTVTMKVRLRVTVDDAHRFVTNHHLIYAIRRAAYRAAVPVAKRTVKFASSTVKYKNWASGADYVEFGLTRRVDYGAMATLVAAMNDELGAALRIEDFALLAANSALLRQEVANSLYDVEVDVHEDVLRAAIDRWDEADYVKAIVHQRKATGMQREEVNAKLYVDDLWAVREGHRLRLRFLVHGVLNPYAVYGALFEKVSWIEAAKYPIRRLGSFVTIDPKQQDLFRPACVECGDAVPIDPLDRPFGERCFRCADRDRALVSA